MNTPVHLYSLGVGADNTQGIKKLKMKISNKGLYLPSLMLYTSFLRYFFKCFFFCVCVCVCVLCVLCFFFFFFFFFFFLLFTIFSGLRPFVSLPQDDFK